MREFCGNLTRVALLAIALSGCQRMSSETGTLSTEGMSGGPLSSSSYQESQGPVRAVSDRPAESGEIERAEVQYGTGRFARQRASSRMMEITSVGDIALNFADADIREVAGTVLGELLEVNYVVDPEVQGRITLQTSRPVPRSAVLSTLESALHVNGAALTKDGDLYKIVPRDQAPRSGDRVGLNSDPYSLPPGYSLQAVPLNYVSPTQMATILEPMTPSGGIIRVDDDRRLLVVAGSHTELQTMLETIQMFDVDWMRGMSFGYFPVRHASAGALAQELTSVFEAQSTGSVGRSIRLVPLERLNALLVISPQPDHLGYAEDWIKRLDRAGEKGDPQLFVYYVENRRAEELAAILTSMLGPGGKTTRSAKQGFPDIRPNIEAVALETDEPGEDVVTASIEQSLSKSDLFQLDYDSGTGEDRTGVRIMADEANNALLIKATKADYRLILTALEKLDLVPLQVMVEATIAEVTLNDELKYGIEWFFERGDHSISFSGIETGSILSAFPGFSYLLQAPNASVVLNALSAVTDVKVISSPQLMVLDNRTARLQVGDKVPVATQSAVSVTDPEAPIVNSIQFFDTGVILNIKPRVNAGGLVQLDIQQEVSDAVPTTTSGIDSPTIQQRKFDSSVVIQSGDTIALGGLIRESHVSGQTGLPVLSRTPVLGHLFGKTTDKVARTELVVLITPRVARDRRDAQMITDELRRRLGGLWPAPIYMK